MCIAAITPIPLPLVQPVISHIPIRSACTCSFLCNIILTPLLRHLSRFSHTLPCMHHIFLCIFLFHSRYPSRFIYHQMSRCRMRNAVPFFVYYLQLFTHLILFRHKYLPPFSSFSNCIIFSSLAVTSSHLLFVFVNYPISKTAT